MKIKKKYIFFAILFSFLVSIIVSLNYVNKYDKLTDNLEKHRMIKDTVRGDWNKADKLNKLKKEKLSYFFYKIDYDKPYLPSRIVALYFSLIKKDIKIDQREFHFETDNGKYFLLVLQAFFYYFCLFVLAKVLISRKENINIIFFIILFLSFEPTINQWHSSFFNESIFFSLQIIILAFFLKINKDLSDYILIGLFCGILFLQKSVGMYYFLIILFFITITKYSEKIKKISLFLISYLIVCLLVGYTNYLRSNNFYFTPLQTKEAMFIYVLPKIYEEKYKISFKEAKSKIIKKTKIWIDENKVDAKIQDNLFATSFGSELDLIKIHTFQQKLVFKEMTSNFLITSKIIAKKYFHSLLINPVEINYYYKYENSESYYKSEDHKKWIPIRIFYTFLIYFISLYGLFTMIKAKKLNRYAFFWIISGFYFYLVLGWMGFTRYFSPALIYISLFFANGMNQIIFNKKKL